MPYLLNAKIDSQIASCLKLIKKVLEKDLLGVYLYGSAVVGGLKKYSDVDLFVVSNRSTTLEEKTNLVHSLLRISGIYMKSTELPIELTIAIKSEINPWHYPPIFDFQYGEWLREEFENENIEPWATKKMPDLAILITQVLLASKTLFGAKPNQLLPNIPYRDFMSALIQGINNLLVELDHDTRNVLLTLARIWCTVKTDTICSKLDSAIGRLKKCLININP